MKTVVYLVTGYIGRQDIEDKRRSVIYNGSSPSKAFEYKDVYHSSSEVEIEIYEDGYFVGKVELQ